MGKFNFELGAKAKLTDSEESGTVIGRAEYQHCENNYLLRYRAGDGRQIESWWGESALTAI